MKYKLDTGLAYTAAEEFETPQEAWEQLRHFLPSRFATLYVYEKVDLPIINEEEYRKKYYSKYGSYADGEFTPTNRNPASTSFCRPIAIGLTTDTWDLAQPIVLEVIKQIEEREKMLQEAVRCLKATQAALAIHKLTNDMSDLDTLLFENVTHALTSLTK